MSECERNFKLFDWQEEIINDDSSRMLLNIPKGGGKSFLLFNKILKDKPKDVIYIGTRKMFYNFSKKIEEIKTLSNICNSIIINNRITIKTMDNKYINIIQYSDIKDASHYSNEEVDLVIWDDIHINSSLINYTLENIFEIKAKKYICTTTQNTMKLRSNYILCDWKLYEIGLKTLLYYNLCNRKYILDIRDKFPEKYEDEYNILNENIMFKENIEICELIKRLLCEYSKIGGSQNNTMYRENILNQILKLQQIESNYKGHKW